VKRVITFVCAVAATATLLPVSTALATTPAASGQYVGPTTPSGPLANVKLTVASKDKLVNKGDKITRKGKFKVRSGAYIVVQDCDGTQGRLRATNAKFTTTGGKLTVSVKRNPVKVKGGNGKLNAGCMKIVTTHNINLIKKKSSRTAVAGASSGPSGGSNIAAVLGNLPFTGSDIGMIGFAGLLLLGGGVALRRTARRS